jgi:peptidoglycan hydrolase-like protein with peptidoglycan-binding domain
MATLYEGAKGPQVIELQQLLSRVGFKPGPADGAFGPHTKAAVEAFQRAHGLEPDGVVGPKTWGALREATAPAPVAPPIPTAPAAPAAQPTLKLGSRGPAVAEAQRLLRQAGLKPGPADGDFGPRTQAAVQAFQHQQGLTADGIVGPKTWAALKGGP